MSAQQIAPVPFKLPVGKSDVPYMQRDPLEFYADGTLHILRGARSQRTYTPQGILMREDSIQNERFDGNHVMYVDGRQIWGNYDSFPQKQVHTQTMRSETEGRREAVGEHNSYVFSPQRVTFDPETGVEKIYDDRNTLLYSNLRAKNDNSIIESTTYHHSYGPGVRDVSIFHAGNQVAKIGYQRTNHVHDFAIMDARPDGTTAENQYVRDAEHPELFRRVACKIATNPREAGLSKEIFTLKNDSSRTQEIHYHFLKSGMEYESWYATLPDNETEKTMEIISFPKNPIFEGHTVLMNFTTMKEHMGASYQRDSFTSRCLQQPQIGGGAVDMVKNLSSAEMNVVTRMDVFRDQIPFFGQACSFKGLPDPSLMMPDYLKLES